MAKARALEKRRRSVRGIRKLTRTMELIATAQFQRAMQRALDAAVYTDRLTALVSDLRRAGSEHSHPLFEVRRPQRRAALLILTANRGMCGGYNSSLLRLGVSHYRAMQDEECRVDLDISGKKGIAALRFRGFRLNRTFTKFEDKPTFDQVRDLAEVYLDDYNAGRIDRLDVVFTKFDSLSQHAAKVETLLPITPPPAATGEKETDEFGEEKREIEYEFLPSPESILDEVVPMSFRVRLFKCFLDAGVSEQVTRMVAMKAATENADHMIRILSMKYNRARQGQITGELLEIIGGADALEH